MGKAGDKYGRLLRSIEGQTMRPKEVVVVLAEGYEAPTYHVANQRIIRTRKGMVNQRQVGFEQARTEWLVVVDDDVELRLDFAETTMRYASEHHADAVFTGGDERNRLRGGGKITL